MQPSRRQFLVTSTFLAGAPRLLAAGPNLRFPAAARDRLCVASYPFRSFLAGPQRGGIALKDFAATVAKRFDVRNVELLGQHFPSTEPAYLKELRDAVKAAGSHVVNVPTNVGASFYVPDAARRETAVGNAKKWIDVAAAIDCPGVRVHIQRARSAAPDVALAAGSLRLVAGYAATKNVVVSLENDDLVSEDAFFLAKVIDAVESPWLRALPDFGNSMLTGNEQFNYDAVTTMFRRAYHIAHTKDAEVSGGKVFRVDLAKTYAIAAASGYRGYFSMEFEAAGDPYEGTQKLIEESLKCLS